MSFFNKKSSLLLITTLLTSQIAQVSLPVMARANDDHTNSTKILDEVIADEEAKVQSLEIAIAKLREEFYNAKMNRDKTYLMNVPIALGGIAAVIVGGKVVFGSNGAMAKQLFGILAGVSGGLVAGSEVTTILFSQNEKEAAEQRLSDAENEIKTLRKKLEEKKIRRAQIPSPQPSK